VTDRHTLLPAPPPALVDATSALFLDADGTLLAFADDPEAVAPPEGLVATLDAIRAALGGALALVSGRPIEGLDRIFARPAWAAAGQHGLERRTASGTLITVPVDLDALARLREAVHDAARALPGLRVEDKSWSVALHWREHPGLGPDVERIAPGIAEAFPDVELQPGNHVCEFKPRGMDKGVAVAKFLDEPPFRGRTPVYLGDDLTDEHAFAVVNGLGGTSVRIGTRTPTHAAFTLSSPRDVHAWLDKVKTTLT
jgi:trehalose 6-phosphate phosphatase